MVVLSFFTQQLKSLHESSSYLFTLPYSMACGFNVSDRPIFVTLNPFALPLVQFQLYGPGPPGILTH